MRRILAITLLIAFGSPFVLPLLASTGDVQSILPACCRRNGVHRCTGMAAPAVSNGSAFKAPPCPLYPTPNTSLRLAASGLATLSNPSAEPLRELALLVASRRRAPSILRTANPKRGPPIPLV